MKEKVNHQLMSYLTGITKFSLDILSGTAVLLMLAIFLWWWKPELFAGEWFWGNERSDFGLYVNVLKTAAFFGLFLPLLALGQNHSVKSVYLTYFSFAYTHPFEQTPLRRDDPKKRIGRMLVGLLGGALLTFYISLFLLPWASDRQLLPESWTLQSQAPQLPTISLKGRNFVSTEFPFTSTVNDNRFKIIMDKEQEYLLIVEPVEKTSGIYTISFKDSEVEEKEISFLNHGQLRNGGIYWQLISVPNYSQVKFEVDFTGSGQPEQYRVHLLKYDESIFHAVVRSPSASGERVSAINLNGTVGEGYVIAVSTDKAWMNIMVRERNGNKRNLALSQGNEMVVFRLTETKEYEIVVRDRASQRLVDYELSILQLQE